MAVLNGEAKYMGLVMAELQKSTHREYAVVFYTDQNGNLYYTDPVAGASDGVEANLAQAVFEVPAGDTIVAEEHTHPYQAGTDETEPSTPTDNALNSQVKNDVYATQTLEKSSGATVKEGGVTNGPYNFDPNMITYIDGSNGYTTTLSVYAYDNLTMLNAADTHTPGDNLGPHN